MQLKNNCTSNSRVIARGEKNNCTSNSRVIARGEAECNFDCYEYNYSLIARKYMRLPTNHIARPMTLYSYP